METKTDFEQERQRLTRWAWGVTGGYGVILLILIAFVVFGEEGIDTFRKMAPNEVGDLLAGVAGPVAFIWLVYGYFLQGIAIRQQAEELQLNTKALELQAEELRNSVEQQRELVDVSKKQFESYLNSAQQEEADRKAAGQPKFVFHTETTPYANDNRLNFRMSIENIGAAVTNVEFSWGSQSVFQKLKDMTTFESGRKVVFFWNCGKNAAHEDLWLSVDFTDSLGNRDKHIFDFSPGGKDGFFNGVMVNRR